jgi:hypothetical protein
MTKKGIKRHFTSYDLKIFIYMLQTICQLLLLFFNKLIKILNFIFNFAFNEAEFFYFILLVF